MQTLAQNMIFFTVGETEHCAKTQNAVDLHHHKKMAKNSKVLYATDMLLKFYLERRQKTDTFSYNNLYWISSLNVIYLNLVSYH